ncbi:MAG: hypothetical protein EZS28_028450, partial [Streblomastix strix]
TWKNTQQWLPEVKSVLGGGGVSELLEVESKKKLNEGSSQQQEGSAGGIQDYRRFGRSQYRQGGFDGQQAYRGFWTQDQWGGWNSGMAPFNSQFAAGPQMFGMGQAQPGFGPMPFGQYQSSYNAFGNQGFLNQYPGNQQCASQEQYPNMDPIILGRKKTPNFDTYWLQRGQRPRFEAQGPNVTAGTAPTVISPAAGTK